MLVQDVLWHAIMGLLVRIQGWTHYPIGGDLEYAGHELIAMMDFLQISGMVSIPFPNIP